MKCLAALRDFFEAVPGFETANYSTYSDYRKDYRQALKDLHECRRLYKRLTDPELVAVGLIPMTMDDINEACCAFSGRLSFTDPVDGNAPFWNYTPGQYYPIEYRAACATVLRSLSNIVSAKWEKANGYVPCAHCGNAIEKRLLSGIDTCPPCSEKWAKS